MVAVGIASVAVGGGGVLVLVGSSVGVLLGGWGMGVLVLGTAVLVAVVAVVTVLTAVDSGTAAILVGGIGVGVETAVWPQPINKVVKTIKIGKRNLGITVAHSSTVNF
jgi:hypothetical protein